MLNFFRMRLEAGTIPTFKRLEAGTLSKVGFFLLTPALTLKRKMPPKNEPEGLKIFEKKVTPMRHELGTARLGG